MNLINNHIPVLLEEVLTFTFLDQKKELNVFDGTLGGGGYSQAILNKAATLDLGLSLVGGDLDQKAIAIAKENMIVPSSSKVKFTIKEGNYADLIEDFENKSLDVIVLDLGFSSNQLESSGRGFSYQKLDEKLDLRYSDESEPCYKKLQKIHSMKDFGEILYNYSGEQLSRKVAEKIWNSNKKTPITVGEMVDLVVSCLNAATMRKKNQILSRIWQSLRIWTNDEFSSIRRFLPVAIEKLAKDGRLIIVSFHSLEDKIVTNFMRNLCRPIELDDFGNKKYDYKLLTTKPLAPTTGEVDSNSRSRSAILRCIQKLI
jgi:16S rRNA (cytosine1402-N4)-methyltransferase